MGFGIGDVWPEWVNRLYRACTEDGDGTSMKTPEQQRDEALDTLNKLVSAIRRSQRIKHLRDPGCGKHDIDERHLGCRECERVPQPTDALQDAMQAAVTLLSKR